MQSIRATWQSVRVRSKFLFTRFVWPASVLHTVVQGANGLISFARSPPGLFIPERKIYPEGGHRLVQILHVRLHEIQPCGFRSRSYPLSLVSIAEPCPCSLRGAVPSRPSQISLTVNDGLGLLMSANHSVPTVRLRYRDQLDYHLQDGRKPPETQTLANIS
jgi:hypothetical protein